MTTDKPFLYPSVSQPRPIRDSAESVNTKKPGSGPSEFDQVLESAEKTTIAKDSNLSPLKSALKLSSHANQRMQERKINIDGETWAKVNKAVDQAEAKGIEDTLVLTSDAALIVNVKNRTVVTAMDKGSLNGNVFTNIDGAVIV